ncbi:uncharacterized protein WCC33_003136 [Rhinophrynus dorsalis]
MNSLNRTVEPSKLDNKNTLKKTKFDLRIIQFYLLKVQETRELLKIPVEELDDHLSNFILTHRKQDGSEYEPGTLRGILGSLDRHFEKSNYPYAIYRSRETKFKKTVKAMKEKQSYLKTIGKGNHPNQAEPLTEREIELLYSTGTIGLQNPTALLHMLFFNIGIHFSLRTMEQHSLKWGDITLKADPRGRKYLEHTKKLALGRNSGKLHPSQTMRMQIYESPEQPERDVVKAYEKYAVERPEKMKRKDAPFYLTPQPDCRPGYARWFKNLPMGETRIRSIMKTLKTAAGLSPQKRIIGHSSVKVSSMRGNSMVLTGNPRVKVQRGNQSMNGSCRSSVSARPSNGHTSLKAEVNADARYSGRCASVRGSAERFGDGSRLPVPSNCSPPGQHSFDLLNHKSKKIKEEWVLEPEDAPTPEAQSEEKSFYPGQVSVTFHDVAACFSSEEWGQLEDWQKELYKSVMREIHSALQAMGYAIVNSDVLLKIKDDEACRKSTDNDKMNSTGVPAVSISPDILLRIKQDELPDWRDLEVPEKEEELDTSNSSLPVFDPDLSLWIFREEPELSPSENATDQVLPTDPDTEAHLSHSVPFPYKEPMSETSTPFNITYPEGPRPGKRKRRPPQRRTSEQRPDTDDEDHLDLQEEAKHRLPSRNPAQEESTDWVLPERLYQCDLCERSYSDRSSLLKTPLPGMALSCPHCGGSMSLHPLFNRLSCTEIEASFAQTLQFSNHPGDTGFPNPMQGPVG